MAYQQEQIREMSGGFSKNLDVGGMAMIYDNLQRYQYQYPHKSIIREVVSNGLDSIREKNVAISILSGFTKIEDHYLSMDSESLLYKDSRFDPDYYDLNFLSPINEIRIVYESNGTAKDRITITDYGVALGGSRLRGYFNLGYSTKRLNKFALGKFGLGAKSPLATGENFYTVTSRYNGKEFSFNIYSHKVESIIPRVNLETGEENPVYTWPAEFNDRQEMVAPEVSAHYRETTEKNSVTVSIGSKKHHKQSYIDAVTSQLLYFDNVRLFVVEDEIQTEIPVKAKLIYEDDIIVMAENAPYSKPHLLLNNVNYGYIDFRELELEEKLGNVGIKVAPEQVSVLPSREALIWDDTTREMIVKRFHEVVGIAEKMVNEQMYEEDFLRWMRICREMMEAAREAGYARWNSGRNASALSRLAGLIDTSKIEYVFRPYPNLKLNYNLMNGMSLSHYEIKKTREGSKTIKKLVREKGWWYQPLMEGLRFYKHTENFSLRKTKFLLSQDNNGFVLIRLRHSADVRPEDITMEEIYETMDRREKEVRENEEKFIARGRAKLVSLYKALHASPTLLDYDTVEVPDSFVTTESDVDEEEDIVEPVTPDPVRERAKSARDRRKADGKVLIHALSGDYYSFSSVQPHQAVHSILSCVMSTSQIEIKTDEIDKWDSDEVFWGNKSDLPLLKLAANLSPGVLTADATRVQEFKKYTLHWMYNRQLRLFMVSQSSEKLFYDFKHIQRFFQEIRNKTITMSSQLIKWNTARLVREKLSQLRFLIHFHGIAPDKYQQYQMLDNYVDTHGSTTSSNLIPDLVKHMDKVVTLQMFVQQNPNDTESIAALATQLFNPPKGVEITDGLAVDLSVYNVYLELLSWSDPVHVLMNLIDTDRGLTADEETEIVNYFKYRNCPL